MADRDLPIAAYAKVVKRAWNDPAFKAQLLSDPAAALTSMGLPLPSGMKVKVVEDTDQLIHLVLPPQPEGDELADESLDLVAAGVANIANQNMTKYL